MNNFEELLNLADEIVMWCSVCNSEPAINEIDLNIDEDVNNKQTFFIGKECTDKLETAGVLTSEDKAASLGE